jgi:hypothetical protein
VATVTTVVVGKVADGYSGADSLATKVNAVTTVAQAAGKIIYAVKMARSGTKGVAVIIVEL